MNDGIRAVDSPERILVGNSFPLSLIRRRAVIDPARPAELRARIERARVASLWGHPSTLPAVSAIAGYDLKPATDRPTLRLSDQLLPELDGEAFFECWIVSPDFAPGYRPAVGEEVAPERILGWQILRLTFPNDPDESYASTRASS
ncbi:MAG TPA: hypothetical protein PLX89_26155 [Verrucomicrobiota bacterium]|nr:hypothetical protein [Verrucomicrobiales bacterium]HRI16493.1 hypothetical protein [Verrucomicrobiota bacterium]